MAYLVNHIQSRISQRSAESTAALNLAFTGNVLLGSMLVAVVANSTPGTPNGFVTVTDNLGNVWTNQGEQTANGAATAIGVSIHTAPVTVPGSCTVSATPDQSSKITMVILEYGDCKGTANGGTPDYGASVAPHLDFVSGYAGNGVVSGMTHGGAFDEAITPDANCVERQTRETSSTYCPISVQDDLDGSERIHDWTIPSFPWATVGVKLTVFDGIYTVTGSGPRFVGAISRNINVRRTLYGLRDGGH